MAKWAHLDSHGLQKTRSTVHPPHAGHVGYETGWVETIALVDGSDLMVLARWLPTLADATVVVLRGSTSWLHLRVEGAMDDGTHPGVVVLLRGDERDLLVTNASISRDALIPPDLVARLAYASVAEDVPEAEPALACAK